jgi:hypothetical protein
MPKALPLLSPLNSKTTRLYPGCRTLAYQRRRLGLTQSRLAAVCIIAALNIDEKTKTDIAKWIQNAHHPLADVTNISDLESGSARFRLSPGCKETLDNAMTLMAWHPISRGDSLRDLRGRLGLSQTRLAVICLIAASPYPQALQQQIVNQIVANQYECPQAGDQPTISLIETGCSKRLVRRGMSAFVAGVSLVCDRPVTIEFLFDDWLAEIEEWIQCAH